MVVYSGTVDTFGGYYGRKAKRKRSRRPICKHEPVQGDRKETAGRPQGWCKETSSIARKKFCTADPSLEEDF